VKFVLAGGVRVSPPVFLEVGNCLIPCSKALCHSLQKEEEIVLNVEFLNKGTALVIKIKGELDHHTAEDVRQKIDNEIMKSVAKNVVFDFSEVSFMDSSGIGVIMGRYKNLKQLRGKVSLVNLKPQLKKIFDMSGVFKYVPVYESIHEAINAM
jgi:stage II sporulation protein AA (anti-sigma F factor antagonist)